MSILLYPKLLKVSQYPFDIMLYEKNEMQNIINRHKHAIISIVIEAELIVLIFIFLVLS